MPPLPPVQIGRSRPRLVLLVGLVLALACGAFVPRADAARGRPYVNAARTTFVADNGNLLRGAIISTETGSSPTVSQLEAIKAVGLNAVHCYAERRDYGYSAGAKVAAVDLAVQRTRDAGLYLIITIGSGGFDTTFNNAFWNFYAPRYADEAHVLYEIQNEPGAGGPPYTRNAALLQMQLDAHAIIRAAAPDTPILFFSYMTFQNGPGALEDIAALGDGIDWNKAAVAFHGYGDRGPAAIRAALETVLDAGYPCVQTEFYRWPWGTGNFELAAAGSLYQDVDETGDLERLGVSWLSFLTLRRVTEDARFKNRLNAGGVTWTPDFGTWPVPGRAVYGNGGEPRELTRSASTRIQAEHFDLGGQGVAYNDNSAANNGGALRPADGVDVQSTSDTGGGHNIGWIVAGEWLEYTTIVRDPGLYTLRLRVASTQPANELRVRLAGADLTGAWAFDGTGDHQAWTTISRNVNLIPGQQLFRVEAVTSGFNLNWIELVPAAGLLPNGTYRIVARHSGRAAEVAGASTSNGAKVRAADTYAAATHQRWTFTHRGANQYTIASALTGKVVDVASGTSLSGDYISLWPNSGVAFQRWIPTPTDPGFFRLVCADSGLVLDVQGASTAAGALVQQWEWAGAPQQQWSITPPFAVSIAVPDADLGGGEGNPGQILVSRDVAHAASLAVNLVAGGSAVAGTHYAALPSSVTIPGGAESVALTVSTISGQLPSEDRTLLVQVAPGTGYAAAPPDSTALTIRALPDAFGRWSARTFSPEQLADPLVSGPLAAPFGDAIPNLLRAALNIGAGPAPAGSLPAVAAEDGHLVLRYRQLAGGTGTPGVDYTAGGLLYIVDVGDAPDSGAWQSGATAVEPLGAPQPIDADTELVAVRLRTPLAGLPRAFMRLRVVRQ